MRPTIIDGVPLYKQPWYGSYHSMIDRCCRETSQNYKFYGGRGIKVCEEWLAPIKFAEWVKKSGYQPGLWIDRIDTEGDYTPENCKWSTPKEQANNRRNNVSLTYKGETHNLAEWAEILGVKKSLIKNRRWRGWSIERIIEQEVENHEKTILTTMPTLTSQNEWVSVKDNIVPTKAPNEPHNNADRIRSMSDEELAREFGRTCPKRNTRACDKRCSRCWLEWLQKPAEGGT